VVIEENEVFDNAFTGITVKGEVNARLLRNQVVGNKCGGFRLGMNGNADVVLDGNTFKDNRGPGIYEFIRDGHPTKQQMVDGIHRNPRERARMNAQGHLTYSKAPVLLNNVEENNGGYNVHPRSVSASAGTCAFCHGELKEATANCCSECLQVSYCHRTCQMAHWKKEHKAGVSTLRFKSLNSC
jgi:hypothetical protein